MLDLLIVCNLQTDYLEGGSVATEGSLELVLIINRIKKKFKHVVFVIDKHPPDHSSFIDKGGTKPPHCVEGTAGCEIHHDINMGDNDYIVPKGTLTLYDSNSAFYVASQIEKETQLKSIIKELGATTFHICGMKYEHDIFATVMDGIKMRYTIVVVQDAVLGDDRDKIKKCNEIMANSGVKFTNLDD